MTAVAQETSRALDLLDRVETLEDVAKSLAKRDTRRSTLLDLVEKDLAAAPPLRPRIAAEVLKLSEKTIRVWIEEGVLTRADQPSPRILLDMKRVHQVLHLVTDLRAAGKSAGLLDEVYRRLIDATWLQRQDLAESLQQMRRGKGTTRVAKPSARSPGDRMPPCSTPSSPPLSPTARSPRSRGARRKTYEQFEQVLAHHGCAALSYRLTGDQPLPSLCVQHLRGKDRVVAAFSGHEAWVLLVGPHHTGDTAADVYSALYELTGIPRPIEPRTKPPCCDDTANPPPPLDEAVIADFVRHSRKLSRR